MPTWPERARRVAAAAHRAFGVPVRYRPGGVGVGNLVSVIEGREPAALPGLSGLGGQRVGTGSILEVLAAEVPSPQAGDSLTWEAEGRVRIIQGQPTLGKDGTVWLLDSKPGD